MARWRPSIHIPNLPNPFPTLPMPHIHIGGTLGEAIGDVQNVISNITTPPDFNFRNEFFEKLNDEAKKLVGDFEGFVLQANGPSKDELTNNLIKRVTPQLTADMNVDMFNNIFQQESVSLFREQYSSASSETCYFVVAGLMILTAIVIIVIAPPMTLFTEGLIGGAFLLAAQGCSR